MLQNGLRLVLLDRLRHHVQNIVHNGSAQFEIIVRFDTLLRNGLRDALAVATFELTGQQVTKPMLEQRYDTTHEEYPNTPSWRPETTTGTLADRPRIEPVIDQMLEILAHPDLSHEFILVSVHASESSDVGKDVLQCVC